MTLCGIRLFRRRSRFFVNTVGLRPGTIPFRPGNLFNGQISRRPSPQTGSSIPFNGLARPHRGYGSVSPHKPAKPQVRLHLPHQLAPGSDGKQDLEQAGPDQPLRHNLGVAEVGVNGIEIAVRVQKRVVDYLSNLPRGIRDQALEIGMAEKRTMRLVQPASLRL